jgi:hypothetical protein
MNPGKLTHVSERDGADVVFGQLRRNPSNRQILRRFLNLLGRCENCIEPVPFEAPPPREKCSRSLRRPQTCSHRRGESSPRLRVPQMAGRTSPTGPLGGRPALGRAAPDCSGSHKNLSTLQFLSGIDRDTPRVRIQPSPLVVEVRADLVGLASIEDRSLDLLVTSEYPRIDHSK